MRKLILFYLLFFSGVLLASNSRNIPEGFEDFFEYQEADVVFILDNKSDIAQVELTFDDVKLNEKSRIIINKLLESNSVKKIFIPSIINGFSDKSRYVKNCKDGRIDPFNCQVKDYGFYLEYNERKLYIILNESFFEFGTGREPGTIKYHSVKNNDFTLINNIRYSSHFSDSSNNYNISNSILTNLPLGYLSTDFDINSDDFDWTLMTYTYDLNDKFFRAGYFKYDTTYYDNKSELYTPDMVSEKYEVAFGNSSKLIEGGNQNNKSIYFNMPFDGWVEFVRNDRTILYKNYNRGNASLSYGSLPRGRYNLTAVLHSHDKQQERRLQFYINNVDNFGSDGELDYKFTAGIIGDTHNTYGTNEPEKIRKFADESIPYLGAAVAKDLTENINVGYSTLVSNEGAINQVGTEITFQNISLGVNYGLTTDSTKQFTSNISLYGLNATYKKVDLDYDDNLGFKLYGDQSNEMYLISYNKYVGDVNLYGSMTYNKNSNDYSRGYQSGLVDLENESYTIGGNYTGYAGIDYDLSFTRSYYKTGNKVEDKDNQVGFLVRIPLMSNIDYHASFFDADDYQQIENRLVYNDLYSDSNYSVSAYIKQSHSNNDNINSIGGNVNYENNIHSASLNSEFSDNGDYFLSLSGNSSIIFNRDIDFSSKNARSALRLFVDNMSLSKSNANKVYGTAVVNNISDGSKSFYDIKATTIIELEPYKDYKVYFDTESDDFLVKGDVSKSFFALPGKVINQNINLHKVKTFIASFEDFDGKQIREPKCIGNGCNGISEIGDGVYSISLISGLDYKIFANNGVCLLPKNINLETRNFGSRKCFPDIQDINGEMIVSSDSEGSEIKYRYIGMVSSEDITNNLRRRNDIFTVENDDDVLIFQKMDSKTSIDTALLSKMDNDLPNFTYNYRF